MILKERIQTELDKRRILLRPEVYVLAEQWGCVFDTLRKELNNLKAVVEKRPNKHGVMQVFSWSKRPGVKVFNKNKELKESKQKQLFKPKYTSKY